MQDRNATIMRSFQETKRGQQVKDTRNKDNNKDSINNNNKNNSNIQISTNVTKGNSTGAREQQEIEMSEIDKNR